MLKFMASIFILSWLSVDAYGSEKTFKIALMGEFTTPDGKSVSWDEYIYKGVQLQLGESKNIELVKINVNTPVEAFNQAMKIASNKDFDIIFGFRRADFSAMAKRAAEPENIPFISTVGTTEDLFTESGFTFGVAIRDKIQARGIFDYIRGQKAFNSRIGIVITKDCTYCLDLEKEIIKQIRGTVYSTERLIELINNTTIDAAEFKAHYLDFGIILLLTDEVEGLSVIKILQQNKYRGVVIGGDSWSLLSMDVDSKYEPLRQICMVNILGYDPRRHSKENMSFVKQYRSQHKEEPNDLAAMGYDSMKAIRLAALKCSKKQDSNHRKCLNEALKSLNFEGATGRIKFSSDGARMGKPQIIESNGCSLKG